MSKKIGISQVGSKLKAISFICEHPEKYGMQAIPKQKGTQEAQKVFHQMEEAINQGHNTKATALLEDDFSPVRAAFICMVHSPMITVRGQLNNFSNC